ncbi:hypothetical protein PTKIN_Ptkin18bG0094600 [Pterospermum kingtungense]
MYQTKPVQAQLVEANFDDDHHQYYWDTFEQLPYAFLDPYVDLNNNILLPQNYTPILPYDPSVSYENFRSCQCPKRQKAQFCSDFTPAFFDGVAPDSCPVPEDHQIRKMSERCVSVQSVAARVRRRKIAEKTQELGKLVPGGNKMNTAEMLQAAFKYVKYLQAQLGILQLIMDSFLENEKSSYQENMQIVTSSKVQEKLYMEDKCLVPKDVVLYLTTLRKPPLSDELSRLLPY